MDVAACHRTWSTNFARKKHVKAAEIGSKREG